MKRMRKSLGVAALFVLIILSVAMSATHAQAKKKKVSSLSKAVVTLSAKTFSYSGKEKKPSVKVMLQGKRLKVNRDIKVSYKNNTKPGKAKVTITSKKKKKFKGKKTVSFKIQKAVRALIPAKQSYTAIEGDSEFWLSARLSKGKGDVTYSCDKVNVIQVTRTGKVTVMGKGTATVYLKTKATQYYKAAAASLKVIISKKPVRKVDSDLSVKTYNYPILNYACKNTKLTGFSWSVEDKYWIPGLAPTSEDDLFRKYIKCNNLCPQGICLAGDYLLTTAYCVDDVHESCVFVYDRETGEYLNTLILTEKSHVGGITYDGGDGKDGNIWICHSESNRLQRIPYSALKTYVTGLKTCVNYKPAELVMSDNDGFHGVSNKPSAIAYNPKDGYLWVTEFLSEDAGREATMAAYEYKDGKLEEVCKYLHPVQEDYLGVATADLEEEDIQETGVSGGAIVVSVASEKEGVYESRMESDDSGAFVEEETCFEEGDIITELDDVRIEDSEMLSQFLSTKKTGEIVTIEGLRLDDEGVLTRLYGKIELDSRSTKSAVRTIPYYVQGVTFTPSGKAVFSRSWGRNQTKNHFISELMVFEATWNTDEMWDADEIWKEEMAVALPPMAEEVEINGDEVYILFESSAMMYLEGTDGKGKSDSPIDKIISVDLGL